MIEGKTRVTLNQDLRAVSEYEQYDLKKNDLGYIDAYIPLDNGVYAVFVRESDGLISLLALRRLRAVTDESDVCT